MNVLGLNYEVRCHVVDRNVVDQTVTEFSSIKLPWRIGGAVAHDHVRFSAVEPMSVLHGPRLIGNDQLMAYVMLRNLETGETETIRSTVATVDLRLTTRLFGTLVLVEPGMSALALVYLFGFYAILRGIAEIGLGYRRHGLAQSFSLHRTQRGVAATKNEAFLPS